MSHAALTIIGEWNLFVGARSEIITGYRKENKLIHTHETPGSQPGKGENKDKKSLSCMEDWRTRQDNFRLTLIVISSVLVILYSSEVCPL
ncbi:uncharacterized protein LOC112059026 isoform X5 [Chrysemys picta bellii]|uniref:uncharacterized protein LOC112059026 isoform X5 n=1 Tax=Chrysemys picta bellii TaxID=8478 RepID=UPI0032B221C0